MKFSTTENQSEKNSKTDQRDTPRISKNYVPDLVSVVIPTYKRPKLLMMAIESVLKQTYRNFEIIVVDDDASNENTSQMIVESFNNPSLRYEKHSVRKGGNAARNTGIMLANGEFIAFLDDDDQWMPNKIEKQIAVFQRDKSIGAVYCGIGSIDISSNKTSQYQRKFYPEGDLFQTLLIHDVTSGTPAYIIRRECFEKVGLFDERLPARQEWDMWIRISKEFKIGCVPEVLVYAGEHEGERVRSNFHKSLEANRMIFHKYADDRRLLGFKVQRSAKAALCYTEGNIYVFGPFPFYYGIFSYLKGIISCPLYFENYKGLMKSLIPLKLRRFLSELNNRGKRL